MTEQITPLRQRMIDDMKIRNMSPQTRAAYIRAVKNFSGFSRQSPDKLTFQDARTYQLHLISRGLQAQTTNQIVCALRFFYSVTLGNPDAKTHLPLARRADILPAVLAPEEVTRFLNAIDDCKYQAAFATIYAAGLRVSEAAALTIGDIDSARKILAHARRIDAILVTELSRWGRSTTDLLATLKELEPRWIAVVALNGMMFHIGRVVGLSKNTVVDIVKCCRTNTAHTCGSFA